MVWAEFFFWLHCLYILGVVVPIPLIALGAVRGWRWVYSPVLRRLHLGMIGIVIVEQILRMDCPLTVLEAAFAAPVADDYSQGWLRYWAGRVFFPDWPAWVFAVVHFAVAGVIVLLYIFVKPGRRPPPTSGI